MASFALTHIHVPYTVLYDLDTDINQKVQSNYEEIVGKHTFFMIRIFTHRFTRHTFRHAILCPFCLFFYFCKNIMRETQDSLDVKTAIKQ